MYDTLHKGGNDDDDDDNTNNNNNNKFMGRSVRKNAVFCTSIPHFVCMQKSFRMINLIIYAKQFRKHLK